jgi:hypothetical protein
MDKKTSKTSFRFNAVLKELIPKYSSRWGGMTRAITVMMEALDEMYRIERRVLRELFSQGEFDLMLNNALSTVYEPRHIVGAVIADTQDNTEELFELYGVSREELLNKLRGLTVSQQYALVDWLMEKREKAMPKPGNEE